MPVLKDKSTPKPKATRGYTALTPRFWHGMPISTWLRLLARNRFAISPLRLHWVVAITGFSLFNSLLRLVQESIYGRRAEATRLERDPVFIVGHWRSGTTMLHEMLVLDPRHSYPTTYQCFAPNHFLLTEGLVSRYLADAGLAAMPKKPAKITKSAKKPDAP